MYPGMEGMKKEEEKYDMEFELDEGNVEKGSPAPGIAGENDHLGEPGGSVEEKAREMEMGKERKREAGMSDEDFDPRAISERIEKTACEWFQRSGAIVESLASELCALSEKQRLLVAETYDKKHERRGLCSVIEANSSGALRGVLLALVRPRQDYNVYLLHLALRKKTVSLLLNVLCTMSAEDVWKTHVAYNAAYPKEPLAQTSLHLCGKWLRKPTVLRFLRNLLERGRASDSVPVSHDLVQQDVRALLWASAAPKARKSTFVDVFSLRSFCHLAAVASEFDRALPSHTLMQVLRHAFSPQNDTGYACRVALLFATRRDDLLVGFLKQATESPGKHYRMLTRLVVMRREIDLLRILQLYGYDAFFQWTQAQFKSHNRVYGDVILRLCGFS